jgi:hypothetical protein
MLIVIQGINPEPWAIGTVNCWGKGKGSISPNPKVVNYQQAIREELEHQGIQMVNGLWAQDLYIMYWRSTERGNHADVTNLNKATEDALQGILINNDRDNRKVTGEIMEQHNHVEHVGLMIEIKDYEYDDERHERLSQMMVARKPVAFEGSDYVDPGDVF